jgi:hypothetical protein
MRDHKPGVDQKVCIIKKMFVILGVVLSLFVPPPPVIG